MHRFLEVRGAIRTRAPIRVSLGGCSLSQVATWTAVHARHENYDFSYSCGFRSRACPKEKEKKKKERRENAASDRNKSAQQQQRQQQPLLQPIATRRCIDACANITRSPRERWIGRLMPAICGYCCYLTVTLCAARCRELRQGTAPREGPESKVLPCAVQTCRYRKIDNR